MPVQQFIRGIIIAFVIIMKNLILLFGMILATQVYSFHNVLDNEEFDKYDLQFMIGYSVEPIIIKPTQDSISELKTDYIHKKEFQFIYGLHRYWNLGASLSTVWDNTFKTNTASGWNDLKIVFNNVYHPIPSLKFTLGLGLYLPTGSNNLGIKGENLNNISIGRSLENNNPYTYDKITKELSLKLKAIDYLKDHPFPNKSILEFIFIYGNEIDDEIRFKFRNLYSYKNHGFWFKYVYGHRLVYNEFHTSILSNFSVLYYQKFNPYWSPFIDIKVGLTDLGYDFIDEKKYKIQQESPYTLTIGLLGSFGTHGEDVDGDGIPNKLDDCPIKPEDHDLFQDKDGCPDVDNDGDEIIDLLDKCPMDFEDQDGFEDEDGCPDLDNDNDSIIDIMDKCRNIPEDKDGFEDEDGCPDYDNDLDSVLDVSDLCPLQAEDIDSFKDLDGCPDIDTDGDGILDESDLCIYEKENFNNYEDRDDCFDTYELNDTLTIHYNILFQSNIDTLSDYNLSSLENIVDNLNDSTTIHIIGHTDGVGSNGYNDSLSIRRAEAVYQYFKENNQHEIVLKYHGENKKRIPVEEPNVYNRRVEILTVQKRVK